MLTADSAQATKIERGVGELQWVGSPMDEIESSVDRLLRLESFECYCQTRATCSCCYCHDLRFDREIGTPGQVEARERLKAKTVETEQKAN